MAAGARLRVGRGDLVGWLDSWSVASDLHMTATEEGIDYNHASPVDHMVGRYGQPVLSMVAQQALTRDLLAGTGLLRDGSPPPSASVDTWPFSAQPPGGSYEAPSNMEEIGAAVLGNEAVRAVWSRVLITMVSGVSVGRLCRKFIAEQGGKWIRLADEAYDLLDIGREVDSSRR